MICAPSWKFKVRLVLAAFPVSSHRIFHQQDEERVPYVGIFVGKSPTDTRAVEYLLMCTCSFSFVAQTSMSFGKHPNRCKIIPLPALNSGNVPSFHFTILLPGEIKPAIDLSCNLLLLAINAFNSAIREKENERRDELIRFDVFPCYRPSASRSFTVAAPRDKPNQQRTSVPEAG